MNLFSSENHFDKERKQSDFHVKAYAFSRNGKCNLSEFNKSVAPAIKISEVNITQAKETPVTEHMVVSPRVLWFHT